MPKLTQDDLRLTATTIRGLAMDGVQQAKSGHPGMPMGMADVAAVLWLKYLEHDPRNPEWFNRDRFVLSGGHGSMLLYSLLHLAGYDLPLEELKQFRQLHSKTPGHPEFGETAGVETSTGPLGQGCGNAVGMTLAEHMLAERFNTAELELVNHYNYVFCGDGDLMEGISHEVFSLAGHLKLDKLIVFYDNNHITIEGSTDLAYSDDVKKRFQGYNWNVLEIDGHDYDQIERAIRRARRQTNGPTIVICHTHIGMGSPNKVDTASVHGEPLGEEEVLNTRRNLGLPEDQPFYVPEKVYELFAARARVLKRHANAWQRKLKQFGKDHPEKADQWKNFMEQPLPVELEAALPVFDPETAVATRAASGKVMQPLAKELPFLVGGSADLAPSTKTLLNDYESVNTGKFAGRNLHFGVREHAMGAVMNGMALHGGLRVYGATFFVFSDYCRPAIRLAAIMKLPVIYVFTHDSFYVGEDGPTHEPVEQLTSLRCMPGLTIIRPADPTETGAAWIAALKNTSGPTLLLLTRQNLKVLNRNVYPAANNLEKGAYTLWQSGDGDPELIIIGSGSEVEIALAGARELAATRNVRVVSMPSWELFEKQSFEYKESVLPKSCRRRLAVEAGVSLGWEKYVGAEGAVIGLDRFGLSGPYKALAEEFGFTTANVIQAAEGLFQG